MFVQDMDLIQQKTGQLQKERKQSLEPLLHKGFELLSAAEAADFNNPALLKQAAQCFLQALQGNQQDIRPYLFLAYLFLLLNDLKRASVYFGEARRHDAQHPLVGKFSARLLELSQQKAQPEHKPTVAGLEEVRGLDTRHLYALTEQEILEQLRLLEELRPPAADADVTAFSLFAEQISQFQKNFKQLQTQLQQLDRHLETHALQVRLHPLETLLKRYTTQVRQRQEGQAIESELVALQNDLAFALSHLRGATPDKTTYEHQLNGFLDRLDALADRIDTQESQGQKSQLMVQHYETTLHSLEKYREQVNQQPESTAEMQQMT